MSTDVNPWAKLILQIGVPSAIALFLVYSLMGEVRTNLATNLQLMREHVANQAQQQRALDDVNFTLQQIVGVQRQTCVGTARNTDDRNACWAATRVVR
jgi:hypothetical protein